MRLLSLGLATAISLALVLSYYLFRDSSNREMPDNPALSALVERIIAVESNGNRNAGKDKRSSATGPGQFLDDTWLESVRKHRRDLARGRSDKELLVLRKDLVLTREIIARLIEQYAGVLRKNGLPISPGSLYLAYFAGPAGAVAVLTGAESADAASLMAAADMTGRTTREKLVTANPFLKLLTVRDLKNWADRRMRGA
jgi:hypothetical protein